MDPITIGLLMAMGAGGTAALARWRTRRSTKLAARRTGPARTARSESVVKREGAGSDLRVGDVLLHLGDEYWLAGELALVRDGNPAMRLFSAPERGRDRWVGAPRAEDVLYVLRTDDALAAMGWPGLEVPSGGLVLRPVEQGPCAITPSGEVSATWEGLGRYGVYRAMESVAVVVEQGGQRLALTGKIIPRRLLEKLG